MSKRREPQNDRGNDDTPSEYRGIFGSHGRGGRAGDTGETLEMGMGCRACPLHPGAGGVCLSGKIGKGATRYGQKRRGRRGAQHAGRGRPGEKGRRRGLSWRPRKRHAEQHGHRQEPRGRATDGDPVPRRADRPERPAARADRPAAVRGAACPGRRAAGARPGAPEKRRARPCALPHPAPAGFDRKPAARHAGSAGPAI